jgi:hypothetical protein
MDIVLGVSMAPEAVQMVLLQGENADGTTVDESEFAVTADDDSPTVSASDRVIAAIVATREDAASAGLELSAVGVACTDQLEAAALRDALTAHKMENVMLVSAFLAATALTQSVGGAMGYERTAVLFVEPDTATLALVETSDGSIVDVHKESTAELTKLVAGLDELPTRPGGLFLVGRGVDIAAIKPLVEAATSLTVSAPEEPETALARGAALASANAPLFASSTAALAYGRDPGTGAVDASALPEYLSITDAELGEDGLAYSAATDDEASAPTVVISGKLRRRPLLLVGTALAVAGFGAVVALEVAMTLGIHTTTVGLLPAPLHNLIAPFEQATPRAPGQVAAKEAAAPKPLSPPAAAPPAAPVPSAQMPAAPVPAAPVPAEAAVPVPVVIPPIAPAPLPPVHLPDPSVSPPVVQAPPHPFPPAEPPPIHVPPRHLPPPHEPPPGQGPWPNPGGHGGPPENPGGGGPVSGPGPVHGPAPVHGTPPGVGPDGGGPVSGPGPSHGTPGGAPPEGGPPPGAGAPPDHGGPVGGGETPSGGAPSDHGGPVGSEPSSGGAPSAGSEPSSGSAPSAGSEPSSGSAPSAGSESSSSGASSSSGDSGGHR